MAKELKIQDKGMGAINLLTHDQIAARAYQIFIERGREPGHDLDDWLQAQYELLQMPVEHIANLPSSTVSKKSGRMKVVELVRSAML